MAMLASSLPTLGLSASHSCARPQPRARTVVVRAQEKSEAASPGPLIAAPNGHLERRRVLVGASGVCASVANLLSTPAAQAYTDDEWRKLVKDGKLSMEAYRVLAASGTERPFTSPLNKEYREGMFSCAACGTALFESKTKFDSGTGWPSFYATLPGVETETDNMYDRVVLQRMEVHCKTCGGHLGHVFNDGWVYPDNPTGKRYCINGVSLSFEAAPGQPEVSPKSRMTEFGRVPVQG